jgi:Zn-dependent metalloprotease
MPTRRLVVLATAALTAVAGLTSTGAATAAPQSARSARPARASSPSGSFALGGAAARSYRLPGDMRRVESTSLGDGRTATRYQQLADGVAVLGGQVTVVENAAGAQVAVIGAHFPGLQAENTVRHGRSQARDVVERQVGSRGDWTNVLRLDPRSGRLFYEIDSIRAGHRPVRWVDAQTGNIRNAYDAATHGEGVGVKGDTKHIDTVQDSGGTYELRTPDDRQETYNAGNTTVLPGSLMTDDDDVWNETKNNFTSPDQRPAVDAHYYAGVVDDFYGDTFGRDSIDDNGMTIISTVHYDKNYCNAFWNGEQMTYGDGNGRTCLPLSGGLDVVGHELTHGVTEFTSNLIYEGESGALNESFSDMMGNTIEFYAAQHGVDPAGKPDWRIGEDVIVDTQGFRNMGDPAEFGDPDHYSELFTGPEDGGGVHTNSGIPNHAYYLAVNGGRNAGCGGSPSGHTHTADCDVTVPAVGLARAEHIFFDGFTSLPEYANMCDARNATVAVAGRNRTSISAAWAAVGVHDGCTPATPPPPPCQGSPNATIPFESPHPYGNNGDCTWTYDNGAPGFAFHFSLLDTEKDFDYVHVYDADGNELGTYTGTHKRGLTTPCIPTSTGSVRLTTDGGVTAQGFTVDAVEPC